MINIIIAEDHRIVREGLLALLKSMASLQVVAETGDGLEAVQLVEEHAPDILVVDLMLPGLDGIEVTRRVKARRPNTRVIMMSMHHAETYVIEALRKGASGYVVKESGVEDLLLAIQEVIQGRRFLSESLPRTQIEAALKQQVVADRFDTLTKREREILHLVAEGHTSPVIADRLFISPRTVEKHRANLMAKLDLHTQTDMVRYAVQRGLVSLNNPL